MLYYRPSEDEKKQPYPIDYVPLSDAPYGSFRAWWTERYPRDDFHLEWATSVELKDAIPISLGDASDVFRTRATYAPWADYRRFLMEEFSRRPFEERETLRMGDPRALILSSGDQRMSAENGRDWTVMGRALDAVGCYHHSMLVELSAMGVTSGQWLGYDDPDPLIRQKIWTALGHGVDSLALYSQSSLINPDITLPEVGRDLAAALLPLRRGVGRLFGLSSPACDGVFVLVSPDSLIVLRVHGYDTRGSR